MATAAQRKDPVEVEARAAAADAAADARAEVLEQSRAKTAVGKLETAKSQAAEAAKSKWIDFRVDVWLTPFNSIEFGFWKRDRNKGKSRQFTSDMDIFAEITEKGERTGVLGYRKDIWKDASGMDKRLVFKLFSENAQLARQHGHDAGAVDPADYRRPWLAGGHLLDQHQ